MDRLDFTLLTDGSSDAVLIHPITWILQEYFDFAIKGTWADLRRLSNPPKDLRGRIEKALNLYPCGLLFVHRDAEGYPWMSALPRSRTPWSGFRPGRPGPDAGGLVPDR